ncbi:SDR family oxidoreductase [Neobacillus niacini]|uniref:SDR family oxidoreductase n=1 Tax=Neobacillus niacini TaxID=86668 RepID=UPI002FFDFE1E
MDLGLAQKVIVLIGRCSPLAEAFISELKNEGANVVFGCIEHKATDILNTGTIVVPCDISSEKANEVINKAIETYGRLDAIVSWLPPLSLEPIDEMEDKNWLESWNPVIGLVRVYKHAIPYMQKQKWGRLIYLGTTSVKEVKSSQSEIGTVIEPGILGLQKTLSGELGPHGILVNSILVEQDVVTTYQNKRKDIDEVAALITFLVSTRSSYINGVTITLDGGKITTLF